MITKTIENEVTSADLHVARGSHFICFGSGGPRTRIADPGFGQNDCGE